MPSPRLELGQVNGKMRTVDRFLKGRTTFVFDMADMRAELPTTMLRSKEDCPKIEDRITANINEDVLKQASKIMSHLRPRERRKKDKKSKKAKDKNEEELHGPTRADKVETRTEVPPTKASITPDLSDLMALGFLKPSGKEHASSEDSYA